MKVWSELQTPEASYHGVNALAVARMAQSASLTDTDDAAEVTNLAAEILRVIKESKNSSVWDEASRGEALIALGRFDEAAQAYAAFADHPEIEAFALGASLRQLEEIWGLKGDDPNAGKPVRVLKTALLATGLTDREEPYLVVELLRGTTLRGVIKQEGRVAPRRADRRRRTARSRRR